MSAILESNYHTVWKLSGIVVNRAVGCKITLYFDSKC